MEFGEIFVSAFRIVFAIVIGYFLITELAHKIPFIGRYALLIFCALIAVFITFMFGRLIKGDAGT